MVFLYDMMWSNIHVLGGDGGSQEEIMQRIRWPGIAAARLATLSLALSAPSALCALPAQAWTFKTLYQFTGGANGSGPVGGLLRDPATGNLYGVTHGGGKQNCDGFSCGIVFKLSASGELSVLHSFGKWEEGFWPTIGLAEDEAGNLFGANTGGGGAPRCNTNGSGCGVVFKLAPDGKYTVLHTFSFQTDGGYPLTRLVRDPADGDIYGTGIYGPEIFRISANGNFMFHHTQSDYYPTGLVRNANGTLFVLTEYGGSCCGTIFKVSPTWKERVVHDFRHRKVEGYPVSLTMDASGNL